VQHLEAGGFEVFAPRIDAGRGAIAQMFPGYIFVRICGFVASDRRDGRCDQGDQVPRRPAGTLS
jgi:hypothetical protein